MAAPKYLNKDDFIKRLNGLYVSWPDIFNDITERFVEDAWFNARDVSNAKLEPLIANRKYLYTETDVDWRNLTCRLLYEMGVYNIPWRIVGTLVLTHNLNDRPKAESKAIVLEITNVIDEWIREELRKEGKFIPQWYIQQGLMFSALIENYCED